jgi:hypothetical protein
MLDREDNSGFIVETTVPPLWGRWVWAVLQHYFWLQNFSLWLHLLTSKTTNVFVVTRLRSRNQCSTLERYLIGFRSLLLKVLALTSSNNQLLVCYVSPLLQMMQ